jgi:hypothetical protein
MKTVHKITLTAGFLLVMAFTFNGCSGDDGNNAEKYRYCVYMEQQTCLSGPFETCANGGTPSNSCPTGYDTGSLPSSSSGGKGNSSSSNGSGNPETPSTYTLVSYNSNSFTYIYTDGEYSCTNGGTLKEETHDRTINYSLNYSANNNILVWGEQWSGDTLHFNGTSNNLIGTWTRTKDKNASCTDYDCKEGWGITKLVFTQNTVTITGGFAGGNNCPTDEMTDGKINYNGWKDKIISCDTYEMSKGTEKVTMKYVNRHSTEVTYNGKTCTNKGFSQRTKACRDAWNQILAQGGTAHQSELEDYYYGFLKKDFEECVANNNFPEGVLDDDPSDGGGGVEPNLYITSFELSYAGSSYANIDAARVYRQSELFAVKENIDLVAYYNSGESDDIKNPCDVTTIGDDCGQPKFYSIPTKYHTILKNATNISDVKEFIDAFLNGEITYPQYEVDEIPIVLNSAFLVRSTSSEYYVVIITATGAQSVTLKSYNPFQYNSR